MRNLRNAFLLLVLFEIVAYLGDTTLAGQKQTPTKARPSRDAYLAYVFQKDNRPIRRFLKPRPGDVLSVFFSRNLYKDQKGAYVVIYESSKKKCVLYVFEDEPVISAAGNYGYGVLTKENEWVINPEDPETGELFESHGGLFTYNRIKELMKIGLERGKLSSVTWKGSE